MGLHRRGDGGRLQRGACLCRAIGPEVMLVDFRLGDGIDGLETIAVLRRAFSSATPAVLVSAGKSLHLSWRVSKRAA